MAPARARLLACLPALTMMAAAVSWVAAGGGRITDQVDILWGPTQLINGSDCDQTIGLSLDRRNERELERKCATISRLLVIIIEREKTIGHTQRFFSGLEVWRIENFKPVPVSTSAHGKFYMGDSYIILKTTALKNGSFRHDIHYWLGKDTSQDEAGTAAILTVELDAALGGRAVQYRELQGNETEKLLSYFRPCIMPQPGGVASGFNHVEVNEQEHFTRLYVPFARSSLNHEDIFILDTKSKIFQFNGSNSCIQERAKALEVVQYIKDTFHEGKCEVAAVEDGRLMADAEAGEFWALFGGFAPLPKKSPAEDSGEESVIVVKLLRVNQGKPEHINFDSLARELLESNKCYLLDCGSEMYVWMGRNTSLQERKSASEAAEKLLIDGSRTKSHVIKVIEGFETVMFKSKFVEWPPTPDLKLSSEDGRGKVAALLKSQGLDVKGLMKAAPVKEEEEPEPYIDCTGHLQVWRVNANDKALLSTPDQSKFYTGDCYIFQYTYSGDDKEECLIGTWFGKKSVEVERASAMSLASKMVQAAKFQAVQARIYDGREPIQFFVIFQSLQVFKGGLSSGYKNFIAENGNADDTYSDGGVALFRIQGSGSENMQALQVDATASSLNSSYCYILHNGNTVFTWTGSLTTSLDHDLVERQLDVIKKKHINGGHFYWTVGLVAPYKCVVASISRSAFQVTKGGERNRPILGTSGWYIQVELIIQHLLTLLLLMLGRDEGNIKVKEVHHFTQDDLMTEDVFVLDCHSDVFVWVGQEVDAKVKPQAMDIGEKFLVLDYLMEKLSRETPIFTVSEGSEPQFFTRFFNWDSAKSLMHGSSYQRKLAVLKGRAPPSLNEEARDKINLSAREACPPARTVPVFEEASSEAEKAIQEECATGAGDVGENDTEDDEGRTIYPYERLTTRAEDPVPDIDVTKRESYLSSAEFREKFSMTRAAFYKLPKWKQNKLKSGVQLF
ncbi:hypothetical protein C2845_PM15G21000 [Panicum miliaceum]|uniref:HP domain-containing protein n=1 Tax=Panicum miliaceum TaxID=4540 RepID=A0A3L6Q568_PANMI|nr:hypothetical protein C2845_PM15G21000 [Panicum miliaceum]